MKSYEIVETLRKSRKAVFTPKDIARKKKPDVLELDANYTDILPFFVLVMNKKEILAEKVRAILTRETGRGIFMTCGSCSGKGHGSIYAWSMRN